MAPTLAKPSTHRRQDSRSNSASSSSIVTVQRAPSHNSKNGTWPPINGLRSQSPTETNSIATALSGRTGTISPETTRRRSSALHTRPDSGNGFREGVGNLNRWSQSTGSSKHSGTHNRQSSFSKRLSGSFGSFSGFAAQTPSPNATSSNRGRPLPQKSPTKSAEMPPPTTSPPPILPPIVTLSSLSQAVDAADSPSTVATITPATAEILSPLTYSSTEPDYFGNGWHSRSSKHNVGMKRPTPSTSSNVNIHQPLTSDQSRSPSSPGPPDSVYSPRIAARLRHASRRVSQSAYHRPRDIHSKGSGTTEGESSASDNRARFEKGLKRKAPSQKAMLSKALQKAHHAVTLDQHSNYEGAMHAYQEACALLQKVMIRSSGIEDRMKLDAVRNTYEARIAELRGTDQLFQNLEGKALPSRPAERDSKDTERLSIVTDTDEDETNLETATATPIGLEDTCRAKPLHLGTSADIPPRQRSLQSSSYRVEGRDIQFSNRVQAHNPPTMQYDGLESAAEVPLHLEPPVIHEYMPPPLSPRRPLSPAPPRELAQSPTGAPVLSAPSDESSQSDSAGQDNDQHTSWLNTINESSGSSASSVHSRRSSIGLRRKHIRNPSGQTEAEFDAALDAAVEAAYDDGFEPDDEEDYDEQPTHDPEYHFGEPEPLSFARRNVELAEENVREAEREAAITLAKEREKQRLLGARDSIDMGHDDDEADEEERMLEEMTRDYVMDDEYDLQTKSALPRQSGSSGFSGRTWGSSIGSNLTSAGTSLSTVAEASVLLSMDTQLKENPLPPPLHPPPSSALPPPPKSASPNLPQQNDGIAMRPPILTARNSSPGVRERRLSGMKRMPLKIETNAQISDSPNSEAPKTQPESILARLVTPQAVPEPPNSALAVPESQQVLPSLAFSPFQSSATVPSRRKGSSPFFGSDSTDVASSTASALTRVTSADSDTSVPSMPGSPARFASKAATGLRKNFSSSSLRIKSLTVSVPDALDGSSNASLSSMSSTPKQPKVPSPAVPTLPTPMDPSFIIKGQPMCGIYLFDSDIHSPISPGSPNPLANNPPLQLEPCPESTMLRPFWFLRSIYQTIAHPRGGYISNRLFVPRDIWRVKNIKLKCVEEKVSSCDLLTAALLKLGKVDTLDANAILEELEFFQNVMEQVQSNLSKKLGNEVGVQGAAQLFKSLGTGDETSSNPEALSSKTTNANSKSYLSWRKLRSKNAVGPGSNLISPNIISKDWSREHPMIESLPMTTAPNPRFAKRDVNQVQCIGPNPSYMGALARLCDAAQILEQVMRQEEDPGLKRSSQTHIGIELIARHAAEFFGFWVCRFVLTDVGIMLDKFIKRGSEWVLA